MRISRRGFALAVPVASISVRRLEAAGVDGKWEGEVPNFRGPVVMMFEFSSDGDTLTGTLGNEMMGMVEIAEGTVSGDEVSFVQLMQRGEMEFRIKYEGKVTGDEMELTRTMQRPAGGRGPGGGRPGAGQRGGGPGGGQRGGGPGGRRPGGGGPGAPVTFTVNRVQ